MSTVVIVCAFDPVEDLQGKTGVMVLDAELAGRLIAEHLAELIGPHINEPLRYVTGSAANLAARDELRAARGRVGVRKVKPARLVS